MNVYGIVILVALLVDFGLSVVANRLNLRALRSGLPEEFRDVYSAEDYRKSQQYTRATTRFGMLTSAVDLLVFLVLWLAGGFNVLDLWLRGFGWGSLGTGLAFIGVLGVLKTLLDLPFAIYSTFVIEERFGFNRTTPWTFIVDRLKGGLLAVMLGAPLLALVLYFFEQAGSQAWIYCWLLSVAFQLCFLVIFPVWVLPLFYKMQPLEPGELRDRLAGYARSVGFGLSDIFVIDGSRRSTRSNAFFTGFGRSRRIALFDTLVSGHTVSELVAVVAHEVGHYVRGHLVKGLLLGIAHSGMMFYLMSLFLTRQGLFEAFYMEHASVYAGLVFFGFLYAPIELILALLLNMQLRRHEYEADRFAAETTGEPGAMVSALKKLSADNLANLTPHPFYVFLNSSHPTALQRIAALRQ